MTQMWQELNADWLSSHSWQEIHRSRLTAMIIVIAVLLVLTFAIILTRTIRTDGYGSRPPPRSHQGEEIPASAYVPRIIA